MYLDAATPAAQENFILGFNDSLDRDAFLTSLNETRIEALVEELDLRSVLVEERSFWLTMARINELALFCAGNYADNCEFGLAGDLLLNPRLILVHVRGARPVVKKRHMALTEQFGWVSDCNFGVVRWLKTDTVLEIKAEALLPCLYERLRNSDCIGREYLESVNERMIRIADLIGYLSSGPIQDAGALHQWLRNASEADRELMESRLCRFGFDRFMETGQEIRLLARYPSYPSRFLVEAGPRKDTAHPFPSSIL